MYIVLFDTQYGQVFVNGVAWIAVNMVEVESNPPPLANTAVVSVRIQQTPSLCRCWVYASHACLTLLASTSRNQEADSFSGCNQALFDVLAEGLF